jgi:hypothetical protein
VSRGGSPFRELSATELSGDLLDPAGRDPLNDHLHQRQNQGLLRSLITFEQLRREGAIFAARDLKGELSDASGQLPLVGAVPVAGPVLAAFIAVCSKMITHLGFENLIEHLLHEQVFAPIAEQDLFEFLVA